MLLKQRSPSLPRNLPLRTFGDLLIVFSTKLNLPYLLYSAALGCCLLHLIKQNCLLKTFLGTLIFMTWVSLYLFSVLELSYSSGGSNDISYIPPELFSICLKESCFPDCWKVIPVGLLELEHLIYPRLLAGFDMLVFFTMLSLIEFQVRYLALFLLFSVIDCFEWFWMGSLHKKILLMLEFLKAPFLVLHFAYYTLMTFLWWCYLWYYYLCWWYYSLFYVRSGIWSVATTKIGFRT